MAFRRKVISSILLKMYINITFSISQIHVLRLLLYLTLSGRPGGYPDDDFRKKKKKKNTRTGI